MTNPIFATTRTFYQSYVDFWRLVELSGYHVCYVDEIEPESANTYIVTPCNGEWQQGWDNPTARIILWQLEWALDEYPFVRPPGVAEVWCSDSWQAERIEAKYVPMGSHRELKQGITPASDATLTYDTAFMGYMVPRRERITTDLTALGVSQSPIHAWDIERHLALIHSKSYLHVHQWSHVPGVPALRVVVAAAYRLPFITETCADAGLFAKHHTFLQADYGHLSRFVKLWTQETDHHRLEDFGWALNELLCDQLTFRKSVEAAL